MHALERQTSSLCCRLLSAVHVAVIYSSQLTVDASHADTVNDMIFPGSA